MDKIVKVKKNLQLQQWAQMVTERQSAGMTVAQWCEHEQISQSVYYYRLRKVRENICEQIAVPVAEIPASANGSQTLYTFFRNIVAPAAMGDGVAGYKLLCETDSATYTYYTTIARYFVSGSNAIFFGVDYIYDTHSPFTYYSAVKYGLFI